jgi:hypothetical protein
MEITKETSYISFRNAIKLKDAGFHSLSRHAYLVYNKDEIHVEDIEFITLHIPWNNREKGEKGYALFEAPTQGMVLKWLRENFNTYIVVYPEKFGKDGRVKRYYAALKGTGGNCKYLSEELSKKHEYEINVNEAGETCNRKRSPMNDIPSIYQQRDSYDSIMEDMIFLCLYYINLK